jgi:thiol:disulfide interchange protein
MKKYLMLLVMVPMLLLTTGNIAQAQLGARTSAPSDGKGINFFQGTWNEALAAAKKEKKLIFVDAYAVWCGPCKYMSNNVFPDAAVGEYFNKYFISYKFDMEKGEGPEFSDKYKVTAYPTLLFINATGEVVYREMGARDANGFIKLGESALAAFKK